MGARSGLRGGHFYPWVIGSSFRILLKHWTCVVFCSVFVLSCVGRELGNPPSESYPVSITLQEFESHNPLGVEALNAIEQNRTSLQEGL